MLYFHATTKNQAKILTGSVTVLLKLLTFARRSLMYNLRKNTLQKNYGSEILIKS